MSYPDIIQTINPTRTRIFVYYNAHGRGRDVQNSGGTREGLGGGIKPDKRKPISQRNM